MYFVSKRHCSPVCLCLFVILLLLLVLSSKPADRRVLAGTTFAQMAVRENNFCFRNDSLPLFFAQNLP